MASTVSYIQYRPDSQLSWLHFVLTPSGDKMITFFQGKIHMQAMPYFSFDYKTLKNLFNFSGIFRGGIEVLVRAKLALSDGVNMQLTVRSEHPDVSELITSTIG